MNASQSSRRFSYQDAFDFLYDRIDYERMSVPAAEAADANQCAAPENSEAGAVRRTAYQFRLRRTEGLLRRLGLADYVFDPDPRLGKKQRVPLVHIAGTKGKGSTATMVSHILTAAGIRVGLYTSPHLTDLEERFRIDGQACSQKELRELVELVAPVVLEMESSDGPVSFFELTTAMAILHFDRRGCDAIVLEVGLGGRLDSTNVCASSVAAITSIGLDHQTVLGDSIAEIAAEKAGIIKSNVPVVSGATHPEALKVIHESAGLAGAAIRQLNRDFHVQNRRLTRGGSTFDVCSTDSDQPLSITLPLEGAHQAENAALAIAIVRSLSAESLSARLEVTDAQIQKGLAEVQLIGRLERFELPDQIQVLLDTAHNHDSFVALCDSIRSRMGKPGDDSQGDVLRSPVVAVFCSSRDKDARQMVIQLSTVIDQFVGTQFNTNPRFMPLEQLQDAISDLGVPSPCFERDPLQALDRAIRLATPDGTVIICGSFFLAGQLRGPVLRRAGAVDSSELSP